MKRILIIILFLLSILIIRTYSQEEPEKKYYGIISGYIEYKMPGIENEKIELYFEEYGNYVSRYNRVTYPSNPDDNFTFSYIYNPEFGYVFYSQTDEGRRITTHEYPFIYNYFKPNTQSTLELSRHAYIRLNYFNEELNDQTVRLNLRGFIRFLGGNNDSICEIKMKARGFMKVGNSEILEKKCIIWEKNNNDDEDAIVVEIQSWKGIVLKWIEKYKGKIIYNIEAITFKEDLVIPFYLFDTPAGMKWEEWP